MKDCNCILSTLYSSQCKLFIFPVRAIPSVWIKHFDFYLKNDKTELAYLIVQNNKAKPDANFIVPAKAINSGPIYKLYSKSKLLEHENRDDRRPSKIVSHFLPQNTFNDNRFVRAQNNENENHIRQNRPDGLNRKFKKAFLDTSNVQNASMKDYSKQEFKKPSSHFDAQLGKREYLQSSELEALFEEEQPEPRPRFSDENKNFNAEEFQKKLYFKPGDKISQMMKNYEQLKKEEPKKHQRTLEKGEDAASRQKWEMIGQLQQVIDQASGKESNYNEFKKPKRLAAIGGKYDSFEANTESKPKLCPLMAALKLVRGEERLAANAATDQTQYSYYKEKL